jgi:hypothetical protein
MAALHSINLRLARIELGLARKSTAKLNALADYWEQRAREEGVIPAVTSEPGFDGRAVRS